MMIRPPWPARAVAALMAVYGAVFLAATVSVAISDRNWGGAAGAGCFMTAWLTLVIRFARLAVFTTDDGRLVVRNAVRTRTFSRAQVAGVRPPSRGLRALAEGNALFLQLTDGRSAKLEATSRWPVGDHRRVAEARRNQLVDWLEGRTDSVGR
jgi:hypothetical protein